MTMQEWTQLLLTALALSTPLLLAALGELIGERAGVLNIGLEGMMLGGAWAGAAASFALHSGWAGLAAGVLCGVALAAIFALLALTLRADPVVVGAGLNLFALGLTGMLHRAMITRFKDYNSATLPTWLFTAMALLLAPLLAWALHRTRLGLQLRATGEYPAAADAAGVGVVRMRWLCTLANGALCGAAGAFLSMAHTTSFAEQMTSGRGFIALAIVILGRWKPLGAVLAAVLFGAADGSQALIQSRIGDLNLAGWHLTKDAVVPLVLALPYVLTLLTLAGFAGRSAAPAALAKPYER